MAQSDRRSTGKDTAEDADDATVSETGSLSHEPAGDSDAPDDGPHPTADLAATDPRSSATAGAGDDAVPESKESSGSRVAPSKSAKAKTGKGKTAKAKTEKAKTDEPKADKARTGKAETATSAADDDEPATKGKASRSGDPARKQAVDDEKPAKVSRTPVKPKRVANRWAAPAMLACAGIGLLWIVVFYVTQNQIDIPWYSDLGSWNLVIGMGFIVAAFGFSMKWQ